MSHNKIDVSLIILNYKSRGIIKQQLRFFNRTGLTYDYEIIVVDNASHDGIGEMLRDEFPYVRFIQSEKNKGYASGNNIGMKAARGRYCVIVNPDIVLTAEAINKLVLFMDEHQQVGIAGPRLINADDSLQYSCVRFPDLWLPLFRRTSFANTSFGKKWLRNYFMMDWDHVSERDVDWLFGACYIVRCNALKTVGFLDERFFLYLEDTDWCRRFWEHGYSVYYVPSVSLIHLLKRQSDTPIVSALFNKNTRIHLMSFIKYLKKYRGKANPHTTIIP